LDNSVRYNFQK